MDQLNLLCGLASGTVNMSCGAKFSVAEGDSDITGLRFTCDFADTPRGSCETAFTEIWVGAELRAEESCADVLRPDAIELASESREIEMLESFFLDLRDLSPGE